MWDSLRLAPITSQHVSIVVLSKLSIFKHEKAFEVNCETKRRGAKNQQLQIYCQPRKAEMARKRKKEAYTSQ